MKNDVDIEVDYTLMKIIIKEDRYLYSNYDDDVLIDTETIIYKYDKNE